MIVASLKLFSKIGTPSLQKYMVKISESVFVEDDPSKSCRVYPNKDHQSYRECDDQFMKDLVSTFDPPITPVWLTDNSNQATSHAVMKSYGKSLSSFEMLMLTKYFFIMNFFSQENHLEFGINLLMG